MLMTILENGAWFMKILILGAAGKIGKILTRRLLDETTHDLVLYARNANVRIKNEDPKRIKLVSGDFLDHDTLDEAMHGVDLVYLNDMGNVGAVRHIIETMQANHVKLIICASILGIYDEVVGKFGEWNDQMIGSSPRNQDQKDSAAIVEER